MRRFLFCLIGVFSSIVVKADVLMVPESCLFKNIYPCLVKISNAAIIDGFFKKVQFSSPAEAVFKLSSMNEKKISIEVLEGKIHLVVKDDRLQIEVNSMNFFAIELFVERQGMQLTAFETKNFSLVRWSADYLQENSQDNIDTRSVFLNKKDMIGYVAPYFEHKKKLVLFLKKIEPKWKIEFTAENLKQTKVLERSVASVQEEQQRKIDLKLKEQNERKKVRETFFQRTFYR